MATMASQGVEEEAPSGGITKGASQPIQGVQVIQDPEILELPTFQNLQFE